MHKKSQHRQKKREKLTDQVPGSHVSAGDGAGGSEGDQNAEQSHRPAIGEEKRRIRGTARRESPVGNAGDDDSPSSGLERVVTKEVEFQWSRHFVNGAGTFVAVTTERFSKEEKEAEEDAKVSTMI